MRRSNVLRPSSVWELFVPDLAPAARDTSETLVPSVKDPGFTHIECLPVSEHPFDGSWGYQPVGLCKLLFMEQEFGQPNEWDADGQLDWHALAASRPFGPFAPAEYHDVEAMQAARTEKGCYAALPAGEVHALLFTRKAA